MHKMVVFSKKPSPGDWAGYRSTSCEIVEEPGMSIPMVTSWPRVTCPECLANKQPPTKNLSSSTTGN